MTGHLATRRVSRKDIIKDPFTSLGTLENLAALLGEFGLAAISRGLGEEDGCPGHTVALTLACLLALALLQLLFYESCTRILLIMDGTRYFGPERERLMW